jgi:hypothetical protein
MSLTKKNTSHKSSGKRAENKTIIITKSQSTANSPFAKKIKAMNTLLVKAKLLSS